MSASKLYVPGGSGSKVYDLYISDTPVSGEAPSGSAGIDEAELWTILTDGEGGEVIDISHIPDIPAGSVTGLLGTDGRISASLLPDFLLGQLLYGGTIGASSVVTLSAAFKDRYNVSASTLTVTASNAAAYEGVYFIASADGTSGIVSSLGVRTGDWVVSSGISWNKIDNTDSVSSVAGLTGVIPRLSLQTALSDSTHRFVTDTQISAWNSKWDWDEADIRAVKVNGAVRADGLSTPRTIALSGGVTGTATAFDGTADISIPVTSVKEAYLSWGGRNIAGGVSPVDAAMVDTLGANRFAFMKPSAITVEYSRNGGQTWTAYPFSDTQKVALFSGIVTQCYIGASPEEGVDKSAYQLRITIDTSKASLYTELKKIVIDCSSSGSTGCWCTVEGRTHGDVEGGVNEWAVFVSRAAIAGWSGYSVINTSLTTYGGNNTQYQQVRLTFGVTEHSAASANPGLSIRRIMGYGGFGWSTPSAMAASGHLYSYDASGNAEFPAAVEADTFIGPLLGNATSATRLQTSRTLWGRPFDGMQNVSGAISSTGNITPSAAGSYNIGTASLWYERIYGRYIDTASGYNLRLCTGGVEHLSIQVSSGNVGIGTTSPAYKLDVAGTLRATGRITAAGLTSSASITANAGITTTTLSASGAVTLSSTLTAAGLIKASVGVQIGSTSDYGWYISTGTRISAGVNVARGVNVGSLLVSNAWADYTKVPTNGIYCKGNVHIAGDYVTIGKSTLSNDYSLVVGGDAWIDGSLETTDWCQIGGDLEVGGKMFIPSSEGNNKYYIRIE